MTSCSATSRVVRGKCREELIENAGNCPAIPSNSNPLKTSNAGVGHDESVDAKSAQMVKFNFLPPQREHLKSARRNMHRRLSVF